MDFFIADSVRRQIESPYRVSVPDGSLQMRQLAVCVLSLTNTFNFKISVIFVLHIYIYGEQG